MVTVDAANAHRHQVVRRERSMPARSAVNQQHPPRHARLMAVQRISRHSADMGTSRANTSGPMGG